MTLHDTKATLLKAGIGSAIGVGGILAIAALFLIGVAIKNIFFPPRTEPPTVAFGPLPALEFPKNAVDGAFTYILKTVSGDLPGDLPDRLSVFPILQKPPDFLNLDKVKKIAGNLGFTTSQGTVLPETQLGNSYYEWDEQQNFNRRIVFNINTYDFKMTSDYLQSLTAAGGGYITQETDAIKTAQEFLGAAGLAPTDININKTNSSDNSLRFITYPQLFSIATSPQGTNTLVPTTKLANTQVIRVDLYQSDLKYDLITGKSEGFFNSNKQTIPVTIPVIYPNPPYSIMSFWITSGQGGATVSQAFYTHKDINLADTTATYPVKTPVVAFGELQKGNAYIASYGGTDNNIQIQNIFLAYYLGEEPQAYAMPVYVFEGNNAFYAYISAITDSQIQK